MKKSLIDTIKQAATTAVKQQPEIIKTAAMLEASELLINKAIAIAKPKLPMMLRGYADTPLFKVLVANAVIVSIETAMPEAPADHVYKQIANAGAVGAYKELMHDFNITDMVESLFSGKEMKALLGKVEKAPKAPKAEKLTPEK